MAVGGNRLRGGRVKRYVGPHQEVDPMNYAETTLPEFDRELANTRKVLERVPDNKLDWQAHPKSHTIGWNANHLAEIVGWVEGWLSAPSWDFAPIGGEPYQSPKRTTRQEILELFDRNVAAARKAIAAIKDDQMTQPWSLVKAGTPLFSMPRDRDSEIHPQPSDPPPGDLVRLSPVERHPCSRNV